MPKVSYFSNTNTHQHCSQLSWNNILNIFFNIVRNSGWFLSKMQFGNSKCSCRNEAFLVIRLLYALLFKPACSSWLLYSVFQPSLHFELNCLFNPWRWIVLIWLFMLKEYFILVNMHQSYSVCCLFIYSIEREHVTFQHY